jgi:hypothetical protein
MYGWLVEQFCHVEEIFCTITSHTLAVRGLEELFFPCLRKVPLAHAPWV